METRISIHSIFKLVNTHFSCKYQINGFIFKILRHYILRPLKTIAILKAAQHKTLESLVVILVVEKSISCEILKTEVYVDNKPNTYTHTPILYIKYTLISDLKCEKQQFLLSWLKLESLILKVKRTGG